MASVQIAKRRHGQNRKTFSEVCVAVRMGNVRRAFRRGMLADRLARCAKNHHSGQVLFAVARAAVDRACNLGPDLIAVEPDGREFVFRFPGLLPLGLPATIRMPAVARAIQQVA